MIPVGNHLQHQTSVIGADWVAAENLTAPRAVEFEQTITSASVAVEMNGIFLEKVKFSGAIAHIMCRK